MGLTTEEKHARFAAALAEAGYPGAVLRTHEDEEVDGGWPRYDVTMVPDEVAWRAYRICHCEGTPCLRCFMAGAWRTCTETGTGPSLVEDCGRRWLDEPAR